MRGAGAAPAATVRRRRLLCRAPAAAAAAPLPASGPALPAAAQPRPAAAQAHVARLGTAAQPAAQLRERVGRGGGGRAPRRQSCGPATDGGTQRAGGAAAAHAADAGAQSGAAAAAPALSDDAGRSAGHAAAAPAQLHRLHADPAESHTGVPTGGDPESQHLARVVLLRQRDAGVGRRARLGPARAARLPGQVALSHHHAVGQVDARAEAGAADGGGAGAALLRGQPASATAAHLL